MSKKKYYETESFKKLHSEWNEKLKGDQFDSEGLRNFDIESLENETVLKPQIFKAEKVQSSGGLDYYEFCQQILREYDFGHDSALTERQLFNADIRKLIFERHTEGDSQRQIVTVLMERGLKTFSQPRVLQIINEIKTNFLRMKK